MNDIASIKKMRPLEPAGSRGAATVVLVALFAALTGFAALETVGDFAVFRVEGNRKF
jgi:hypothetical protein